MSPRNLHGCRNPMDDYYCRNLTDYKQRAAVLGDITLSISTRLTTVVADLYIHGMVLRGAMCKACVYLSIGTQLVGARAYTLACRQSTKRVHYKSSAWAHK